jgi:rare lipoprotein A (peptidoglycan hydrolase)
MLGRNLPAIVPLILIVLLAGAAVDWLGRAARPPEPQPAVPLIGPPPAAPRPVYRQVGLASWYGPGFHGRPTASGATFDQHRLTAAHRSLPLGARVTVTRLDNGRSVKVEISDRGPYVRGRVLDLSRAAAARLGMLDVGVARVRIELGTS